MTAQSVPSTLNPAFSAKGYEERPGVTIRLYTDGNSTIFAPRRSG